MSEHVVNLPGQTVVISTLDTYKRAICVLTDIKWDKYVDGEEVPADLPQEMEVEVDIPRQEDDNDDSTKDIAVDIASDFHGFCIKNAHVTIKTKYTP